MKSLIQLMLHFIGNWFFNSLAIYACSAWMKGIDLVPIEGVPVVFLALELGLVLTLMNALLRPILLHLLLPLNGLTVGLFSLVVNGFFIFLLSHFSQAFVVESIWVGVEATFVFAILNMLLQILIPIDDDIMNYSVLAQRSAGRRRQNMKTGGIVMLEIDGLSYPRLIKAINTGHMPFLKEQTESGRYTVRPYDCGVPSQTSSCQAGIMYGRNDNICAFRWYDKKNRRVFSSSNPGDASDMEKRLFAGSRSRGILDNGLSVNNIISGNASDNIFTISRLVPRNAAEQDRRNRDLYNLSLRPYLLTKSLILTVLDAGSEVLSYFWDCITCKEPRLNRLHGFYPFIRGATNILLRDISTAMIVDAVSQGRESMYTTFIGYDEIAHHSGPDSREALNALGGIDRAIRKIFEAVELTSARRYEIVILSDHGQSFGWTFKQRYGETLGDYIRSLAVRYSLLGKALKVISVADDKDNSANVMAVLTSLLKNDGNTNTAQTLEKRIEDKISSSEVEEAIRSAETEANDILVLASGNLVNAYFQIRDERLTYEEIEETYPGMISEMISHPGVGTILVHTADSMIAVGKNGRRDLISGNVTGEDPLAMYQEPEMRADQLRYLLNFPNGGDLVIISPVYEDGTVAAYEELIGSHGGLGGQQTEPFLMHSSDIKVSEQIRNANQVYDVLKRIKNSQVRKAKCLPKERTPETTSLKALWKQIRNTGHWIPALMRSFYFSPTAYKAVVNDPTFNGPALLIQIISFVCAWIAMNSTFVYRRSVPINFGLLVLILGSEIVGAYLAVLILRGKRNPWKLTRAVFFGSYWEILWLFILTRQALPAWILVILIFRINAVASAAYTAGELGPKRLIPLFVILLLMIPLFSIGLLLLYGFSLYAASGGSLQIPFLS